MKMNNKSISTIDSKYNNFENEGLINENDKENNTDFGLKYNISSGFEFYPIHDFKICTDDTIRYCF